MTSAAEIRDRFRRFFAERGHEIVPSSSIVPANDPTLMFVNAGMVQFKDVFTGQETRPYKRATSSQKCLRVSGKHNDLENVGVTARHHTFFEMLGNFSFGDYFKEDAITYAWEFLTETLRIPKQRLVVSIFGGEGDLPADTEAEAIWRRLGIPKDRIIHLGAKDNFWSMGDTGPCGPCTEIHFFFGKSAPDLARFGEEPDEQGEGWVEIWNNVFMQFERLPGGKLVPLPAQSVDTGMGLERLSCVVQNVVSNYDTDLLRPIVELAAKISGKKYGATLAPDDTSMRVIADHARATAFLISEGVFPDREGRAYVLRRIMRRAIRHGHRLGIEKPFLHECALKVVELMGQEYSELRERSALIEQVTRQEEERFRATLKRGLDRLSGATFTKGSGGGRVLPGAVAFELYDTYGFPLDLQEVIGREQSFDVDMEGFEQELERARERSQGSKVGEAAVDAVYKELAQALPATEFLGYERESARSNVMAIVRSGQSVKQLNAGETGEIITAQTPLYAESGGQVGDQGEIRVSNARFRVEDTVRPREGLVVHRGKLTGGSISVNDEVELEVDRALRASTRRNHSATHLLHLGLRSVVGPSAMQKGSLVGPDRLRFDYSAGSPLTPEQIAQIEDIVTDRVLQNAEVTTHVLPMAEAKSRGAIGIFEEKYGEVVRMLTIADSIELCGGTHVRRTGDIGAFKILSDTGIAAGVRRIEATTGMNALRYTRELEREMTAAAALLKASPRELTDKVERLIEQRKEQAREIEQWKRKLASGGGARDLAAEARKLNGMSVLGATVDVGDAAALRDMADKLRDKLAPAVIALGGKSDDGRALLVCTVSKELTKQYKAGDIIKELAAIVGGGGGGRPDFAQAGGNDASKLDQAMARVYELVGA